MLKKELKLLVTQYVWRKSDKKWKLPSIQKYKKQYLIITI